MPRRQLRRQKTPTVKTQAPTGFAPYLASYLEWLEIHAYSPQTVKGRRRGLIRFFAWCDERAIDQPQSVTRAMLERFQRHLFHQRRTDGRPLAFHTQAEAMFVVKSFFKWAARQNYLLYNPASEIEMPRLPRRLPRYVLSHEEVERVLNETAYAGDIGIRDRAIIETLYSTGLRRMELANLKLYEVDWDAGCLWVREGKGKKDRVVPIGERALHWIRRYLNELRASLILEPDEGFLFISDLGLPFSKNQLSDMVKKYLLRVGISAIGACHLFRHACATHMLEGGADIRFIQALLGHAQLTSTEIYTRVSVKKLKEIHNATHPARLEAATGDELLMDKGEYQLEEENAQQALLEALVNEEEEES